MTIFRSEPAHVPSRRFRGRWLGYAVILIMALAGARVMMMRSFDNSPLPPALSEAARLPITLPDGRDALLGDVIKPGIPTVITLWASWCGPCRSEAPKIAELRRRFGRDKLNLVYLNVRDSTATSQDLAGYMTAYGMAPDAYAVLSDDRILALTNATDVLIPRTLVFDRTGRPTATITGYKPLALGRIEGLVAS
jgi:thiol-disulfide isomerase/thioredoxin